MSLPNSPDLQGIPQPHPQEAAIRAMNARRVAQRSAYASLAQSIQATDFDSLRRDPQRQIGGQFEALQKVPKRKANTNNGQITQADINDFLKAFSFESMTDITPRKDSIQGASTGGPNNVGTQALATNRVRSQTTSTPYGGYIA